jgi:hypothetical protein
MNVAEIRNFLMRAPRPAMVRVVTKEAVHDLEVETEQNWSRLAETVEALEPTRLELYSEESNLLRAERLKERPGSGGVAPPAGLASDPETLRLTHFANLLHRSYEHSTDVAFDRLVQMFERQTDQLSSLMNRLEATEGRYYDLLNEFLALANTEPGESDENPIEGLARAFGGGVKQAAAERPPKPPKEPKETKE